MKKSALDTLIKFISLNPDLLADAKDKAFFRARYSPELRELGDLDLFQTFRPFALPLLKANFQINPELKKEYDLIFYLPTKYREENHYFCAKALSLLKPGGKLICSLENELGSESLKDRLKAIAGNVESYSKNHCRVFYAIKDDGLDLDTVNKFLELGTAQVIQDTKLQTAPGMFSWNKLDQGSQLLAEAFSGLIKGKVADFGAGYGFLAASALNSNPNIEQIDLYEAELTALDLARKSMEGFKQTKNFFWSDLISEKPSEKYDFIICNPPFHVSRNPDVTLGKLFISQAAQSLKHSACLFLVANQFLPYEATLESNFRNITKIAATNSFKVFQAFK